MPKQPAVAPADPRKRRYPAHAVVAWPDDATAEVLTCKGTKAHPGCGKPFGAVARHADGRRCGRDRCPHCGARRKLPDSLHPLYLQWRGLISHLARLANRKGALKADYYDIAHDAYIEALLRWLPERGAFSTFATHHIRYRLVKGPPARPLTFTDAACQRNTGDGNYRGPATVFRESRYTEPPAAEPAAEPDVDPAAIAAAIDRLPERTARVVRWRFGIDCEALTTPEIAERLGVSKQRVNQIYLRALDRLRDYLPHPSKEI
jgi:RNA polymerase sigma factor (sigma-70 family)